MTIPDQQTKAVNQWYNTQCLIFSKLRGKILKSDRNKTNWILDFRHERMRKSSVSSRTKNFFSKFPLLISKINSLSHLETDSVWFQLPFTCVSLNVYLYLPSISLFLSKISPLPVVILSSYQIYPLSVCVNVCVFLLSLLGSL